MTTTKRVYNTFSALESQGEIDRDELRDVAMGLAFAIMTEEQTEWMVQEISDYQNKKWASQEKQA